MASIASEQKYVDMSLPFEETEEKLFQPSHRDVVNSKIITSDIAVLYKTESDHMIAIEQYDISGLTKTKNHFTIIRNKNGNYFSGVFKIHKTELIRTYFDDYGEEQDEYRVVEIYEEFPHLADLLLKLKDGSIIKSIFTNASIRIDDIISMYHLPHTHDFSQRRSSCKIHNGGEFCDKCRKFLCCIEADIESSNKVAELILKYVNNKEQPYVIPKKILYTVNDNLYFIGTLNGSVFSSEIATDDNIIGYFIVRASKDSKLIIHWENLKHPITYREITTTLINNKQFAINLLLERASALPNRKKYLKYKQKYLQLKKQLNL
jgi:hypothetical protein